ncbi:MAG TPA: hypothetical protein VM260_18090, partial [Pirellula sp.]|nr:hypothetical protein [Pirellula sp.]
DSCQGVLWRIANGEINSNVKTVHLLIGTNNLTIGLTADQISEGIQANVEAIKEISPSCRVIVGGLLPRTGYNDLVAQINNRIALDWNHFDDFLIHPEYQPDGIHPNVDGYEVLGPTIRNLLINNHGTEQNSKSWRPGQHTSIPIRLR